MNEGFSLDQIMQNAWHDGAGLLIVLVVMMALALLSAMRNDRKVLFNTLGFFLFTLLGLFVASLVSGVGYAGVGATLHELFIVAEGLAVIRIVSLFLFLVILPLVRLRPASIIEDMAAIVAYLFWGMFRLHEHGVELSSLVATSAVITAVIAFAMQDTLGNILGGLALQLDNSIAKGEWIKVDDVTGRIVDIRWRSTTIETRNWETVVIPNSVLMKNKFLVLGRRQGEPEQWRRWIWFNIDYSVQPSQVIRVVESAIRRASIPGVAREPAPNCVMMDYDDSSGRYALRYWLTDLLRDDPTDSAVRMHIFAALQRAGLKPAWPRQMMHMVEEGEAMAARRNEGHIAERVTMLRKLELFAQFNEEELRMVAERLVYAPFASGDVITGQGDVAHWLYILTQGEVEVVLEAPGQKRRVVGNITAGGSGSFFGEMGLLTGAPRSATVIARNDVLCYGLDKRSFEDIMHARPGLAEEISLIMAERRTALESMRSDVDEAARRRMTARNANEVLAKIRTFFGL
jgi:small-conductance mechanosensitive channel/CRP-like cAMP-binding protein